MNIGKTLELSTAHLAYATSLAMDHGEHCLARTGYGYLVFADPWDVAHEEVSPIPKDLIACMKLALDHNCTYILFDSDEPIIEELPTYDW